MLTRIMLSLVLIFPAAAFYGQKPPYQNLYFAKKGQEIKFEAKDYMPAKSGFYLYRNCIYALVLKNKLQFFAKVTDIKKDSIYYTLYINEAAAYKNKEHQDTFSIHPASIRRIKMVADRIMSIYSSQPIAHYNYAFTSDLTPKRFETAIDTIFTKDSSQVSTYELVPYLTAQGIDRLYEQCGVTYYYRGISDENCEDITPDKFIRKDGIWFSPSNANKVRGINIGLQTMNFNGDPLTVNGVNLNADLMSLLVGSVAFLYMPFDNALINLPDSADISAVVNTVRGLSLSFGGLMGNNQVNGVSINGGFFSAIRTRGLIITGSQNLIDDFRGVIISALRNRTSQGKGVQIGLLNICKHLKGVQIGLWNVNDKRRLPFINWSF